MADIKADNTINIIGAGFAGLCCRDICPDEWLQVADI